MFVIKSVQSQKRNNNLFPDAYDCDFILKQMVQNK